MGAGRSQYIYKCVCRCGSQCLPPDEYTFSRSRNYVLWDPGRVHTEADWVALNYTT